MGDGALDLGSEHAGYGSGFNPGADLLFSDRRRRDGAGANQICGFAGHRGRFIQVSINGPRIGGSSQEANDWSRPSRFNVAGFLTLGHNTIAVEAVNTARGPAGLLLKLRVVLQDGTVIEKCSDSVAVQP